MRITGVRESRLSAFLKYLFMVVMAAVCVYPLYFAVSSSFKTTTEIMESKLAFPKGLALDNYVRAFQIGNIGRVFLNSLWVTMISIVLLILLGTLGTYVLSRFRFRFQGALYTFFIAGLMVPMQSVIIPIAFDLGALGIKNSYTVLVLLFVAFQLPITVFILAAFLRSIPTDLEEAAVIDGCGALRVFRSIILPMSTPAVVTASIFNFINIWNNLLFPLVFLSDQNKQLMSFGMLSFFSQWSADYGGVMAAITIAIIPPVLIYIILQEKVEQGMMAGAVKG